MKRILFLILFTMGTRLGFAQTFVNPDTTQQPGDIYIQNTDVYYYPMAPPGDSDTRENLCNLSTKLRDPNGVGAPGYDYFPVIYDSAHHQYDTIQKWAPHGVPLGTDAIWQRFFTAKRHGGIPSNLIAGSNVTDDTLHTNGHHGPVIISKNEDVDFRASGTVKLENGFHARAGCFFHAYQEPRWSDSVFSDDFNSSTLNTAMWHVTNAHNDDYEFGAECSSDSGVQIVLDTGINGALDGHALDIILREVPDTCSCFEQDFKVNDTCNDDINSHKPINKFAFSGAMLRSCPFPWVSRDSIPLRPAYEDAPYGKYEVREKIPHVMHHVNNWEYDQFEYDMNECWNGDMNDLHPGAGTGTWHGPYIGYFSPKSGTDTTRVFRSRQASFCLSNNPYAILVAGNFDFDVNLNLISTDTFLTVSGTTYNMCGGKFPSSYADSTGSITFYYRRQANNTSDLVTWTISPDGSGSHRIFSAPYRVIHGVPLIFTKSYQPTSVTIIYDTIFHDTATLHCHWIDSLNDPTNYGKLYLDDTLPSGALDTNTQAYGYTVTEGYGPVPPYGFDGLDTTGYAYHTFTMELLPHETRILMDSNVVWRGPDRLDPPSDSEGRGYWVPRSPVGIHPAEIDIDENGNGSDLLGEDTTTFVYEGIKFWNSITGHERQWFDQHDTNRAMGCWDVTIGGKTYHAAHHLIDYVKVWDLPADVEIPKYPR